jgi:hypothetical protein
MTTEQQHSGLSCVDVPTARPAEAFAAAEAEERADFEEDRRGEGAPARDSPVSQ